jgi:hypothetical protein
MDSIVKVPEGYIARKLLNIIIYQFLFILKHICNGMKIEKVKSFIQTKALVELI